MIISSSMAIAAKGGNSALMPFKLDNGELASPHYSIKLTGKAAYDALNMAGSQAVNAALN
jgi:hypothetical protein